MFSTKRTTEQETLISQLVEIFKYDKDYIIYVCETQDWKIDDCIEHLVTYGVIEQPKKGKNANNTINYAPPLKIDNKENVQNVAQNLNNTIALTNQGAVPKNINSGITNQIEDLYNELAKDGKLKNVIDNILAGYKIMILMRGAPGSGKSYLSRQLIKFVQTSDNCDYKSFIFSTDDFFLDVKGKYIYQREKLSDAHEFNQRCVRKKAMEGWSPIIVDNTNIKIWEMLPYVQVAIQYGYIIAAVEPNTPWKFSASKLALKNSHNVPKEKLQRILMNYEPVTEEQLIHMIKSVQYTVSLPQMRKYPQINVKSNQNLEMESVSKNIENQEKAKLINSDSSTNTDNEKQNSPEMNNQNSPKSIQNTISSTNDLSQLNKNLWEIFCPYSSGATNELKQTLNIDNTTTLNSWTIYKSEEQTLPSGIKVEDTNLINFEDSNDCKEIIDKKLEEEEDETISQSKKALENDSEKNTEKNQSSEVVEENENNLTNSVAEAEWQPYERESDNFWNVAPKPQRNIITRESSPHENILKILKEREPPIGEEDKPLSKIVGNNLKRHAVGCPHENQSFIVVRQIFPDKNINGLWELFEKCDGNAQWVLDILLKDDSSVEDINDYSDFSDFQCECQQNIQENVSREDANDLYPQNIPLTKDNSVSNNFDNISNNYIPKPKRNNKEKMLLPDGLRKVKETIENRFILDDSLYSDHVRKIRNLKHNLDGITPNINLSSLTEQPNLQGDENCSDDLDNGDDENGEMLEINLGNEFIQQLEQLFGVPPISNLKKFKPNIFMPKSLAKQLYVLWMESIYNQLEEEKQEGIKKDEEFAKLLQSTPESNPMKRETYKDILDMDMAWSIYKSNPDKWKDSTPKNLAAHLAHGKLCEIFPDIEKETLLQLLQAHNNSFSQTFNTLNNSVEGDSTVDEMLKEKKKSLIKLASDETDNLTHESLYPQQNNQTKKKTSDDAKKAALRDFEECRNLAVHHSQLKAECYEKAKEAIQKGNSAVAVYYSQISELHKNKIDYYNHKAANCIMEVHDLTQNNPDFIDLHYLYAMEALECLDLFLDNHILKLRMLNRPYKHIFIITGRGLHSVKGVSTIKNKVKIRLKDRTLKWSEVNPGLLKVKVFSGSKFSKNS